jgi:predicted regulator of Ras-like GTPase activity (Roadblock/LC7/MglB family)
LKSILQQINLLPEVIGSMLVDSIGENIAHEMPPLFDSDTLVEICSLISENTEVLKIVTDEVVMLDFRYQSGRVVIRSINGGYLLLLCSAAVNMPFLNISINVAAKRLEKLLTQPRQCSKSHAVLQIAESQPQAKPPPATKKQPRTVAFSI